MGRNGGAHQLGKEKPALRGLMHFLLHLVGFEFGGRRSIEMISQITHQAYGTSGLDLSVIPKVTPCLVIGPPTNR